MALFVGTNVTLGSAPMIAFVRGMHSAFLVSTVLVLFAAGISFVRGKEDRNALSKDSHKTAAPLAD
jgi:hypothetical protein